MKKKQTNYLSHAWAFFLVGALFVQNAVGQVYKWNNVAMGGTGFVSGIITSKQEKDLMYARTDVGGAYKWNATSKTWEQLLDWASVDETGYLGVEALAIDPQAPNKLYMLVGISYFNSGKSAILRSNDYGKTFSVVEVTSKFKAHGNGMGRQNGERLAVDPNNGTILFCGTRANGLFKSTDAGASWNNVGALNVTTTPNSNGVCFVLFDAKSGTKGNASQTIFLGVSRTGDNLYVSKNGGTSFSSISGGPSGLMPQRAVLASDGNLFITYANGAGPHGSQDVSSETMDKGQVWKYNTANNTWANVTPLNNTYAFGGISVDPNNPQRLLASSINVYNTQYPNAYGDRFFLSTDGGTSWKDLVGNNGITLDANGCTWVNGHAIHWAGSIEFDPYNTNQAWITSGNGVFKCEDLGATKTTWKFYVKGMEESVPLDIVSISGGPLVSVIGDYDGFRHTDVSQYAPIHTPRVGTTTGLAYVAAGSTSLMVRVGNDMYYSTDQGVNWIKTATLKGVKGKMAISADAKTILHCPENSSTTYYSTDKGASWTAVSGLNVSNAIPVADAVNANKFYAYDQNKAFYTSTNGGKTFSTSLQLNDWGSKILRTVPGKEGDVWFAGNWDGLKRSTNSGASFTKLGSVQECAAVGFGKAATGKTFPTVYIWGKVNNVVGVFRSIDEGASWTRINDDNHEYGGPGNGNFVIGDMNTYGRVYMSTAGRGIVYGEPATSTALLDVDNVESSNYSALCFPNPSPSSFTVRTEGAFSYSVYDLTGNLMESGHGTDQSVMGSGLPTGMFVVKVHSSSGEKTLKVAKY